MYLDYFFDNLDVVGELSVEHLRISVTALALALPLALLLGVMSVWFRPVRQPVLWLVGTLYTVPSLAMIAFLIPSQGLGLRPTLILLIIYAQVFLVRNIVTGLTGVDASTLEAARGLGMTPLQVLRKVWLPIALPVILAGIRITFTTIIGLAVLGGWVAAGGLGELLFTGINTNHPARVMAGVIAIVGLALLADLVLRGVEYVTPIARARRAGSRR